MRAEPTVATWLLTHLAPSTPESVLGDLQEEYQAGRSAGWFYRQVLRAIVTGLRRDLGAHPFLALRAVITGWTVLLLIFALLGDRAAETIAEYGWNWSRYRDGYGAGLWWPFWIAASVVSYSGFAISAGAVARLHGMTMVAAYLGSVLAALSVGAAIVAWVPRPVGVPHTLYYVIAVGLPFVWHSGFVLVPIVMLVTGLLSCRTSPARP
jgi:hypothetical protein